MGEATSNIKQDIVQSVLADPAAADRKPLTADNPPEEMRAKNIGKRQAAKDYDKFKSAYEWKLKETKAAVKLSNNALNPGDPFVLDLIRDEHLDKPRSGPYHRSANEWKDTSKMFKYVQSIFLAKKLSFIN